MDNVVHKLMDLVGVSQSQTHDRAFELHDLIENGGHLPDYDDIQRAHKVFIDSLDDNHPKAVEMLVAADELRRMAEQLRVDRDATHDVHDAITSLLGCAMQLASDSQEDAEQSVKDHFYHLLDFISDLTKAHMKYTLMVRSMGPYKDRR